MGKTAMKKAKKILVALFLGFWVLGSTVCAASVKQFTNYVLDNDGNRLPIPEAYTSVAAISVLNSTGRDFNSPQDLFVSKDGAIFVADTGNNRVLKLDDKGNLLMEITNAGGKPLSKPQGVFVDELGHIFIADSANARIVHLSATGSFIEEFGKPQTNYLTSIDLYSPTKVFFSDSTGYLYTIMGKELLTLDAENEFKGYFAANKLEFSLKNLLIRRFATQEQKKRMNKPEPVSLNNVHYQNNRIYAVSAGTKDNIRVINNVGNNLFPSGTYGEFEIDDNTGLPVEPVLIDITVDNNKIITVAQENNSRLYQFDMEGNLLAVFGGFGKTAGYFELITSIGAAADGTLYVLDAGQKNIQILKPTRFTELLHTANQLYHNGEYEKALGELKEVQSIAPSYRLVREKLGDIYYKQKDFRQAMKEYRIAEAQNKYAKAFEKQRYMFFRDNFLLVVAGFILVIIASVVLVGRLYKLANRAEHALHFENPGRWKTSFLLFPMVLFHPVKAFERIKHYRKQLSFMPSLILLALLSVIRIIQIYCTNYTVSDTTPENSSLFYELIFIIGPFIVFTIVCYLVTALQMGECTFKELFLDCAYSLSPLIVGFPILTAASRIIGASEQVFYKMAVTILIGWTILLMITAAVQSNQYSVKKTVKVLFMTIVGIALLAALAIIFVSLTAHVSDNIKDMLQELRTLK